MQGRRALRGITLDGPYAADLLATRVKSELGVFKDWLMANSASGIVGEVGWPYDESPNSWNALGNTWVREATRRGLGAMYFDAGQMRINTRDAVYQPASGVGNLAVAKNQAAVVGPKFRTSGGLQRGIFILDGAANSPYGGESTSTFSNAAIGTYGTDYIYPSRASFDYIKAKGHDTVSLQLRWERLQPTLGAAFNATESTRVQTMVADAKAAGLNVILQMFNKGSYYLDNAGTGERKDIGSVSCTEAHFQNFWSRISTLFKTETAVIAYALQNEPFIDPLLWEGYSQNAVAAIRALPDTKLLIVPQCAWFTLSEFGYAHPAGWITDSASNFLYEARQYFDGPPMAGTYGATYAVQLAAINGALISDTFTRADAATLGAPWVNATQFKIASNRAAQSTGADNEYSEVYQRGYHPYGTLQFTLNTVATKSDSQMFLTMRTYSEDRGVTPIFWQIGADSGVYQARKIDHAGTATYVYTGSGSPVVTNGDVVKIRRTPGSFALIVNGTTVHTRTNADVGFGTDYGMAFWNSAAARASNWSFTPDWAGG